jgi:tetratricopeptide (TPR) repeat protein
VPSLADHAVIPGSAPPLPELDAAWALLEQALTIDPTCAPAHAARGNVLVRRGKVDAARRAYALAARFDPADAASRIALGELAAMAGEEAAARTWFAEAFALTRVYAPAVRPGARPVLMLARPGPWHQNIPLDFIIDPARWSLQRWYLAGPGEDVDLPPFDLAINAIGAAVDAQPALAAAARFIGRQTKPALNDPGRVARTARDVLAATLDGIAGCAVAPVRRVPRAALPRAGGPFPLVVRPTDAHGGRGLERIDDAGALADYAARVDAPSYDLAPFVDYRSADGWYRKYRVMFAGGEPLPYHLAIDGNWMIHYHRAPMGEHAWMRAEETRFLTAPDEALACPAGVLQAIGAAVGLEYFGIDCTVLPDGTLHVFEADAAMLVHDFDPRPAKRAAVARIRSALDALLVSRAGAAQPFAAGA